MKVQVGHVLQTWTVRLDSITPKSVLDDKGSNHGQAIKNMLLIVNRHIRNVFDVLLRKYDEMKLRLSEWMLDSDAPVCFLDR